VSSKKKRGDGKDGSEEKKFKTLDTEGAWWYIAKAGVAAEPMDMDMSKNAAIPTTPKVLARLPSSTG
jgi:hypothetical protein